VAADPNAAELGRLREELATVSGPLPWPHAAKLLSAYRIPLVRSAFAATAAEALERAGEIGYPVVLKISSPDIPHRSDAGGVRLGIESDDEMRAAIDEMLAAVRSYKAKARIEGFELQEELSGWIEAMAGFSAARPFTPLTVVGTGGTLVELYVDRAVASSPFSPAKAEAMINSTRLGALLGGYRNLLPRTELGPLAELTAKLSKLAADFASNIGECDINPVLVRPGTGEVRVVDALLIAGAGSEKR
jgi:acetyltransferase